MDNRKNTILLTVIAVATLLVAVVGATFAYFTAQGGGTNQANVNVETETSASSSFNINGSINIHATPENFDDAETAHLVSTPEITATVNWTPSTAAEGDDLNFCYTVELEIDTNELTYTVNDTVPELLFNISKKGTPFTEAGDIQNLEYKTVTTTNTGTRPEVSGWDITTATGTYKINGEGTNGAHQMASTAGVQTSESWTASATLVNLNTDQQNNTQKSVVGKLVFTEVDCTTGNAD